MAEPRKEYHARIWVKLTDDLLPGPVLSKDELEAHLIEGLNGGAPRCSDSFFEGRGPIRHENSSPLAPRFLVAPPVGRRDTG